MTTMSMPAASAILARRLNRRTRGETSVIVMAFRDEGVWAALLRRL
jgi:hypothetical protein